MTTKTIQWLSPTELYNQYGFSTSIQSKWRMSRRIPFHKIGAKFIKYNREEIDAWIQSQKIEIVG